MTANLAEFRPSHLTNDDDWRRVTAHLSREDRARLLNYCDLYALEYIGFSQQQARRLVLLRLLVRTGRVVG